MDKNSPSFDDFKIPGSVPITHSDFITQNPLKTSTFFTKHVLLLFLLLISTGALAASGTYLYLTTKSDIPFPTPSKSSTPINFVDLTPSPTGDVTSGWKVYENKEQRITFKYPTDWYIADKQNILDGSIRTDIVLSGNYVSEEQRPDIAIIITDKPASLLVESLQTDYKASSAGSITTSNLTGILYTGTGSLRDFVGKKIANQARADFFAMKNGKTVWFRLATNPDVATEHISIFRQILSTFTIK